MNNQTNSAANVWEVLKQSIRETVPELGQQLTSLTQNSRLSDLGISSIDLYEVVGNIEDIFDIELPTDQLAKIRTVGELQSLVESLLRPTEEFV